MHKRKFIFSVAVLSLIVAVLTFLWIIAFWYGLSPAQESLFMYTFRQRFAVILVSAFFSLCAIALILGVILHYYLIPLKRLVEETTLIAMVNPSHRIRVDGARDILQLAKAVNEGADRFQRLQNTVKEKIKDSTRRETEERNILATVISRLTEGVLLCNNDGAILLYNGRARQLLSPNSGSGGDACATVGLGRSLTDIVEKRMLLNVIEVLDRRRELGDLNPTHLFVTAVSENRMVRLRMTLMMNNDDTRRGFLVTCYDMMGEHSPVLPDIGTPQTVLDGAGISRFPGLAEPFVAVDEEAPLTRPHAVRSSRPEFYDFDLFEQTAKSPLGERWLLSELSYTVFDTETTGLDPVAGDEIISIGAVRIVNGRILSVETFDHLVDPQWYMRPEVIRIHGITPEMLEGQPTIDKVLPLFQSFVGDTVLVGHNCAFDMRFLQLKEEKTGIRFTNPVLDTLLLSQVVHPHQETHTFEAIAERMGVDVVGRHTALGDAIIAGRIFCGLIPLLKKQGIGTLGEALIASRQTYFAKLRY